MCGIWLDDRENLECFEALRPRGPDVTEVAELPNGRLMGFHRLAVVGGEMQPFFYEGKRRYWLVCNGEIYNHRELRAKHLAGLELGDSDCAVLAPLIDRLGLLEALELVRGEFALVAVVYELDRDEFSVMAARDLLGVRPLFFDEERCAFASEAKGLPQRSGKSAGTQGVAPFPPGGVYTWFDGLGFMETLSTRLMLDYPPRMVHASRHSVLRLVRESLETAVVRRLQADQPVVGCLLSGGLDSSIVAALAARAAAAAGKRLELFTAFLDEASPDLHHARLMAAHLGLPLNEVRVESSELLGALEDCIHTIESHDTTTVRASLVQYQLARHIAARGDIKAVLCGEAADELFQGYLYFRKQPSVEAGAEESRRLLRDLYLFDGLRADRTLARWGLEARLPFADEDLVRRVLHISPLYLAPARGVDAQRPRERVEKFLLREAFEDLLPPEVCWRRKEAFSDAVSAEAPSGGQGAALPELLQRHLGGPEQPRYREIFERSFQPGLVPYLWLPRWTAAQDPSAQGAQDPSARTLDFYDPAATHHQRPAARTLRGAAAERPQEHAEEKIAENSRE